MAEQVKFTEEEMKSIQQIQQEYQNKVMQLGQLELEKIVFNQKQEQLFKLEDDIRAEFKILQDKEKQLVDALNVKYGVGTLNPQTGEFTPSPKVSE